VQGVEQHSEEKSAEDALGDDDVIIAATHNPSRKNASSKKIRKSITADRGGVKVLL